MCKPLANYKCEAPLAGTQTGQSIRRHLHLTYSVRFFRLTFFLVGPTDVLMRISPTQIRLRIWLVLQRDLRRSPSTCMMWNPEMKEERNDLLTSH